jgi:hypothetical protein
VIKTHTGQPVRVFRLEGMAEMKRKLAAWLLPWAGLLTLLPYSNRLSRFLDRVIALSEGWGSDV